MHAARSYAKALHYKELEFQTSPSTSIEPLISINNQLERPEAAVGILRYAQNPDNGIDESLVDAQETTPRWYEKLGRWDDALEAYERKQRSAPEDLKYTFARLRCLKALGEWKRLAALSSDLWSNGRADTKMKRQVAPLAARAAWAMGHWDDMERCVAWGVGVPAPAAAVGGVSMSLAWGLAPVSPCRWCWVVMCYCRAADRPAPRA